VSRKSSLIEDGDHDSLQDGKWTHEEHRKFLQGLKQFGIKWKNVQEVVQTRNAAQVRSHAQKFFVRM
jgi:SHAQKYF class myb-like DNA-binding protein